MRELTYECVGELFLAGDGTSRKYKYQSYIY